MFFTDLPSEVIFLILSQPCVSDDKVYPFLYCRKTYDAARHRLIANREIRIKCQDDVILLSSQYEFGIYGVVLIDEQSVIKCDLDECVGFDHDPHLPIIVRHSRSITINVCFEDFNTGSIVTNLGLLASLLKGTRHKSVLLQVTAKYWDPVLSGEIVAVLVRLSHISNLTVSMQLHTPMWYLPVYACGTAMMNLEWLNIQSMGSDPQLDDEFEFPVNKHLKKLKLNCNFLVPNMNFRSDSQTSLTHLELDLPIEPHTKWVQNANLLAFTKLRDLRLFTLSDFACLRSMFRYSSLMDLRTLYISFREVVPNYADFHFEKLAPGLMFLFLSDRKATITKRHR